MKMLSQINFVRFLRQGLVCVLAFNNLHSGTTCPTLTRRLSVTKEELEVFQMNQDLHPYNKRNQRYSQETVRE